MRLCGRLAGRASAFQALLECVHQVDDIAGPLLHLCDLDRFAGGLALHQRFQRLFVRILERRGMKVFRLAVEDMPREGDHVLGDLRRPDVLEIAFRLTHLIRIAQSGSEQPFAERLDRHHMLAVGQNDAGECNPVLVLHGVADDGEGIEADLAVGSDIVGTIEIALVDLRLRHKAVDVDGVRAFDLDCFQLLLIDLDKFALADLISARLLVVIDSASAFGIDHLLLQAVIGPLVEEVEFRFTGLRRGGIKQHRTAHQRQFERAFPIRTRGHPNLQCFQCLFGTPTDVVGFGSEDVQARGRLSRLSTFERLIVPSRKLSTYRKKRDFEKTAEPSGEAKVLASKRPRFVVQMHAATRLHYDFRLEFDGVFKSWAVTRGPSLDPHDKRLAVEVEDHPLDYGDFEGTIPDGQYGGGTVQLWDRGYWTSDDPERGFRKGDLKFTLDGDKLHGSWVLVRMRHDRNGGKRINWLLIKHRDEYAREGEGNDVLEEDRSVASGRSMDQIAAGKGKAQKPFMTARGNGKADAVWHSNRGDAHEARTQKKAAPPAKSVTIDAIPEFVAFELCASVEKPPGGAGWGHEIKFDGYRVQIRVEDGKAVLRTRKGLDWTDKFTSIAKASGALPDAMIDGEIDRKS